MGFFLEAKSDESSDRSPRSTEPSILPYGGKFGTKGNLLPEHVDLGLRLTVGEDVVQKPFLPSTQERMNYGHNKVSIVNDFLNGVHMRN